MKRCPRCGKENSDKSLFCEHCGFEFAKNDVSPKRTQGTKLKEGTRSSKNSSDTPNASFPKWPFAILGLALLGAIVGIGLAVASRPNIARPIPETTVSSSSADTSKYDELIAEAKELTNDGEYKKSNLRLRRISASDLEKSEFSEVAAEVDELTKQNEAGLKEESEASQDSHEDEDAQVFTGEYAKWAGTYQFYYSQTSQKQRTLTISASGKVTQKNTSGGPNVGKATIMGASGEVLSYETNRQHPTDMPDTKLINPNVQIIVTWEDGSTQTYYGYVSYSSRLALTDGVSKNNGVNEVWVS